MAKKRTLTPIYLPKPMREGEDQETYEITVTANEENLNQNLTYLNDRIFALESRLSSKEENTDGNN